MNLKEVVTALSAFEDERRLVFPDNVFIEYIGHDGDEEEYNGLLAQLSKNEKFKLCDDFGFYFSQQEISNVMEAIGDDRPEKIIDDRAVISLIGQLKKFWPDKTPIQVTQKISYIVLNLIKLMEDGLKIAYYGEIDENKYFSLFLYHLTGKDVIFIEPLKTLEAITGVPNSKLVTMKGTFATRLEPLNERIRKGNKVNVRNTNVTNIIDNKAMNVIGNIIGTEKDFIYKEIKVKFPIYSLIQLKDEWEVPLYARQDFLNTNERVEYSAILYEICGIYSDTRKYINLYNEFISEIEAEAQIIDELFNDKEFEKKVSASLISKMAGNYIHPDEFQKYESRHLKLWNDMTNAMQKSDVYSAYGYADEIKNTIVDINIEMNNLKCNKTGDAEFDKQCKETIELGKDAYLMKQEAVNDLLKWFDDLQSPKKATEAKKSLEEGGKYWQNFILKLAALTITDEELKNSETKNK